MPPPKTHLSLETLEEALNLVYATSVDMATWIPCLETIGGFLDAKSGMLGLDDTKAGKHLSRIDFGLPSRPGPLTGSQAVKDLWTQALIKRNPQGFMHDVELAKTNEADHRLIYAEGFQSWLKSYNLKHSIGAYANRVGPFGIRIAFQRHRGQSGYSDDEKKYLNRLLPHIKQALKLSQLISDGSDFGNFSESEFNSHREALLLVTSKQRVVLANTPALQLAASGKLIQLQGEKLFLPFLSPTQYESTLASLCRDGDLLTLPPAFEFSFLDSMLRPCHFSISRFQNSIHNPQLSLRRNSERTALALVKILSPTYQPAPKSYRLVSLFNLSRQEVEIAILLSQGQSTEEIALKRARSSQTIRTQIKKISRKMRTHTLNETVSLLNQLLK